VKEEDAPRGTVPPNGQQLGGVPNGVTLYALVEGNGCGRTRVLQMLLIAGTISLLYDVILQHWSTVEMTEVLGGVHNQLFTSLDAPSSLDSE